MRMFADARLAAVLTLMMGAACGDAASREEDTVDRTDGSDTGTVSDETTDSQAEASDDTDVQEAVGWSTVPCGTKLSLREVYAASADEVYAVGGSLLGKGVIVEKTGDSFAVAAQPAAKLFGVGGDGAGEVRAVGYDGVFHTKAAAKWTALPADDAYDFQDVLVLSPDEVYAVGDYNDMEYGVVARFENGAWVQVARTVGFGVMHALWASSPDDIYAVGTDYPDPGSDDSYGVVLHYDGSSWSTLKDDVPGFYWAVWGDGSGHVLVGGFQTGLWRYDGSAWEQLDVPIAWEIADLWGTAPNDYYLVGKVGDEGLVVHRDLAGFHQLDFGVILDPLDGVHGASATSVYAVGGVDSNAGTSCTMLRFTE